MPRRRAHAPAGGIQASSSSTSLSSLASLSREGSSSGIGTSQLGGGSYTSSSSLAIGSVGSLSSSPAFTGNSLERLPPPSSSPPGASNPIASSLSASQPFFSSSSNLVVSPAATAAAVAASGQSSFTHSQGHWHASRVVDRILGQLLNIALTDPEASLRAAALKALRDARFASCLAQQQYLRSLFIAQKDEAAEVCIFSSSSLCRLTCFILLPVRWRRSLHQLLILCFAGSCASGHLAGLSLPVEPWLRWTDPEDHSDPLHQATR
jgi:hypothetical protein